MNAPNRIPIAMTSNIVGHDNPTRDPLDLARHPDFLNAGLPAMTAHLREKRNRGFTRYCFHMLQGHPRSQTYYCSSNWHTLSPRTRLHLSRLPSWLASNYDLFTGFQIVPGGSRSLAMPPATLVSPNLLNPSHRRWFHDNWSPWRTLAGFRGTVFHDSGSAFPSDLALYTTQVTAFRAGGEAFPVTDAGAGAGPGGRTYNLNTTYTPTCPWLCSLSFYRSFKSAAPIPWSTPTATTEMHVIIQAQGSNTNSVTGTDPAVTQAEVNAIVAAGFIVSCQAGTTAEVDGWITAAQPFDPGG